MGFKITDKDNLKPDEQAHFPMQGVCVVAPLMCFEVAYHLLADRASKQSSFSNLLRKARSVYRRGLPFAFHQLEVLIMHGAERVLHCICMFALAPPKQVRTRLYMLTRCSTMRPSNCSCPLLANLHVTPATGDCKRCKAV